MRRAATGQSCVSPPVNRRAIRRPLASASAWIFVLRPPRERPIACLCSPLFRLPPSGAPYVRGVDHLRVGGSSVSGQRPEQILPNPAPRPAHETVIDRCRRPVLGRAIAPATAALQHMHDAANDTTIIGPLHAPDIRRQVRFDPLPLLIAQPKQVASHRPSGRIRERDSENQQPIHTATYLLGFDPSSPSATAAPLRQAHHYAHRHSCRPLPSPCGFGSCLRSRPSHR